MQSLSDGYAKMIADMTPTPIYWRTTVRQLAVDAWRLQRLQELME